MLSSLSIIFAAAFGVPGGCEMWETIMAQTTPRSSAMIFISAVMEA